MSLRSASCPNEGVSGEVREVSVHAGRSRIQVSLFSRVRAVLVSTALLSLTFAALSTQGHAASKALQDAVPDVLGSGPQAPVAPKVRNKILLIPLDSRPAAGQFAQMIAAQAGAKVLMPPYEALGRFTTPANVRKILDWLDQQPMDEVASMVVSADMIAYGGLIASREYKCEAKDALRRLRLLMQFHEKLPDHVKLYLFATTMRLTPTATKEAASYRLQLARLEELRDKYHREGERGVLPSIERLKKIVPPAKVAEYRKIRARNHEVQIGLLRMMLSNKIDFLVMGQDDAKPDGPHIGENIKLRKLVDTLRLNDRVYFCEGIDQHANILVSRSILEQGDWRPKVRVVYSDPEGPLKFANYESKTIAESLADQLAASGAKMAEGAEEYDYTLFLNTPKRNPDTFKGFLEQLKQEVDQGFPVAVADINFGPDGTSDPELFDVLMQNDRAMSLLTFAGWNTAGNTMGTAIPAANVYLYARRFVEDPLPREVAKREFLLHRMVDDYAYHKYTRPAAYKKIDEAKQGRDEVYGELFKNVNEFVKTDLTGRLLEIYYTQFKDRPFFAGPTRYRFTNVEGVRVFLPWPRAYETRIEFKLIAEPYPNPVPGPNL